MGIFYDFILRYKLRCGLYTFKDTEVIEGVVIRTWAIPQEDNRLIRPKPPVPRCNARH